MGQLRCRGVERWTTSHTWKMATAPAKTRCGRGDAKVLDVGTELTGRMSYQTSQDFDPSKEPLDEEEELETTKKTKRNRSMDVPPR